MTVPSPTVVRTATAALWAAAVAAAVAAVWLPYRLPPAGPTVAVVAGRPATGPTTAGFDDLLDLTLRRPPVDPPPGPATGPATTGVPAAVDVRLAGIVAEPGHSFAVLVTPAGGAEVRSVGERTAGGTEVLAISPEAVTVRAGGRTTTLRLPAGAE